VTAAISGSQYSGIGTVIQWNTTQQDDSTALPPNIGPA